MPDGNDFVNSNTNTSFSEVVPGLQLYWDSVSLGALKTCPRYYYYAIIVGLSGRADSVHLSFGLGYHHALETYDRLRAAGADHPSSLRGAVKDVFTYTWNAELGRPWSSDDPYKNLETLVRTVVWYLDQFEEDPAVTVILENGKPAVELSFRYELELEAPDGQPYFYCGHLDKVVTLDGRFYIMDRKTSKHSISQDFFERFTPDNQMSGYDVAGDIILPEPHAGIIIDAAQVLVNGSRFQRGFIKRTAEQRDEWLNDARFYLRLNETYVAANYWPMNDKACNSYISEANPYGCPFRPICGVTPSLRSNYINALYQKRTWDPRQTREV